MANVKPKMVPHGTVYVTPRMSEALDTLNAKTEVPTAVRVRQGIELILKAHAELIDYQSEPEND